jgi:aspartyl-tRNA(Asn)/glutamyl-tRNA(Gln) amidotransferase subunit A
MDVRSAGFGAEVQRRIMVGNFVLSANARSAYFDSAVAVRSALLRAMTCAQDDNALDVFLTPTAPTPAWKQSEQVEPVAAFLNDVYTVAPSLCGMPACSVPVRGGAVSDAGVLQSVQVFARHGMDKHVLSVAAELEAAQR